MVFGGIMLSKDMKHEYQAIDFDGYFLGSRLYQLDPERHIKTSPPKYKPDTQKAKWDGKKWVIEDINKETE
jgi:hypothetical protein